jgi:hypothetical protein
MERYFSSVEKQYNIVNVKKTDRDILFDFWNDKLLYGANMFTLIDHRKRCLFNALWDVFGSPEIWNANRQAHNIIIKIQNSCGWTLPLFGAYLFQNSAWSDFLLSGINPYQDGGYLITNLIDNSILRKTGSALRMQGNDSVGNQCGAQVYPIWKSTNGKSSVSMFCQFRVEQLSEQTTIGTENEFDILNLTDGTNSIGFTANGTAAVLRIVGFVKNATGFAEIRKTAAGTYADLLINTWYDLGITFDGVQNKVAVYYCPSAVTSFTDFLNNKTDIEDGILSTLYPIAGTISDYNIPETTWTSLKMLYENYSNSLVSTKYAYLQNIFIINGYMTAMEFNFFRRLCYYWNAKTSGAWPK